MGNKSKFQRNCEGTEQLQIHKDIQDVYDNYLILDNCTSKRCRMKVNNSNYKKTKKNTKISDAYNNYQNLLQK